MPSIKKTTDKNITNLPSKSPYDADDIFEKQSDIVEVELDNDCANASPENQRTLRKSKQKNEINN